MCQQQVDTPEWLRPPQLSTVNHQGSEQQCGHATWHQQHQVVQQQEQRQAQQQQPLASAAVELDFLDSFLEQDVFFEPDTFPGCTGITNWDAALFSSSSMVAAFDMAASAAAVGQQHNPQQQQQQHQHQQQQLQLDSDMSDGLLQQSEGNNQLQQQQPCTPGQPGAVGSAEDFLNAFGAFLESELQRSSTPSQSMQSNSCCSVDAATCQVVAKRLLQQQQQQQEGLAAAVHESMHHSNTASGSSSGSGSWLATPTVQADCNESAVGQIMHDAGAGAGTADCAGRAVECWLGCATQPQQAQQQQQGKGQQPPLCQDQDLFAQLANALSAPADGAAATTIPAGSLDGCAAPTPAGLPVGNIKCSSDMLPPKPRTLLIKQPGQQQQQQLQQPTGGRTRAHSDPHRHADSGEAARNPKSSHKRLAAHLKVSRAVAALKAARQQQQQIQERETHQRLHECQQQWGQQRQQLLEERRLQLQALARHQQLQLPQEQWQLDRQRALAYSMSMHGTRTAEWRV